MDSNLSNPSQKPQSMGTVISTLRHDLRTPINAIIGYSEMVLEDLDQENFLDASNELRRINTHGYELLTSINRDFDVSIEKSIQSWVDLQGVLNDLFQKVSVALGEVFKDCQSLKVREVLADNYTDIERIELSVTRLEQMLTEPLKTVIVANVDKPDSLPEPVVTADSPEQESIDKLSDQTPVVSKIDPSSGGQAHILVVDDNENNRDLLSRQLQRENYLLSTAVDGKDALEKIANNAYDLVLLDLMMPEMDGYQVLERLKSDQKLQHIPVIMISASDELDQVVRCIEIGAEDYLPKPFNPTLLKARIGATLDKKQLRDRERQYLQQVETYSRQLNQELEKGRQMQLNFLPSNLLKIEGWEMATFFRPARQVAGDFYDVFPTPGNRVGLVIADVCDKGVGAALFMALFRSLIRIFSAQTPLRTVHKNLLAGLPAIAAPESLPFDPQVCSPAEILEAVSLTNDYVAEYHGDLGMFATLFFGILDPNTGILTYINGGHEPLFIVNTEGEIRQKLNSTGPAVGMLPSVSFKISQTNLEDNDILIGYTDGVPESRAPNRQFFTNKQLLEILKEPVASSSLLIQKITDRVLAHISDADQFDDITLLAIQRSKVQSNY